MPLLRIAWRNIWRNVRRSVITMTAMTLGVGAIVFIHSYNDSAFRQMVASVTAGLIGHLQIHGSGYQENPEIGNTVQDPVAVQARLSKALPGAKAERRVLGYGLAGSGDNSSAALVLGIQPEQATGLLSVEKGRSLSAGPAHEVVLGKELANQLDVHPGSELILVSQAADGSVANDRYQVVGIADAGNDDMNATAVFMHLQDAQDFFALGQGVHQILVRLPSYEEDLSEQLTAVKGALDLKSLEALSWSQILPELKSTMQQKRQNLHMLDVVVFLIVVLGVLNTTMMSTFERTREFGVLASLGTRPNGILRLVLAESVLQGALGLAAGVALALAGLYSWGTSNLAAVTGGDVLGLRMPSAVQMQVDWNGVISAAVTILVTAVFGALWPAVRAARLNPADAVRHV
jgi:putative ABC transport system permease protein